MKNMPHFFFLHAAAQSIPLPANKFKKMSVEVELTINKMHRLMSN
jgi:hypothetical protein